MSSDIDQLTLYILYIVSYVQYKIKIIEQQLHHWHVMLTRLISEIIRVVDRGWGDSSRLENFAKTSQNQAELGLKSGKMFVSKDFIAGRPPDSISPKLMSKIFFPTLNNCIRAPSTSPYCTDTQPLWITIEQFPIRPNSFISLFSLQVLHKNWFQSRGLALGHVVYAFYVLL